MRSQTVAFTVIFLVTNCLMGCGGGLPQLPTSPTSAASIPSLASSAEERWNLTRTFTGHSGSEGCTLALDAIGGSASESMLLIRRSDSSMRFFTADHNTYVGTLAGNAFSAIESEAGSTLECEGARIRFRTEANIAGVFSSDGRTLVGKETSAFLLESGKTITRHWDWQARRD